MLGLDVVSLDCRPDRRLGVPVQVVEPAVVQMKAFVSNVAGPSAPTAECIESCLRTRPPHFSDLVASDPTRSLDLYGVSLVLADQRSRDRGSH